MGLLLHAASADVLLVEQLLRLFVPVPALRSLLTLAPLPTALPCPLPIPVGDGLADSWDEEAAIVA